MRHYKLFKNRERAEAYAAEVNGKVYTMDDMDYKLEMLMLDYPEGLEVFEYIVIWED